MLPSNTHLEIKPLMITRLVFPTWRNRE